MAESRPEFRDCGYFYREHRRKQVRRAKQNVSDGRELQVPRWSRSASAAESRADGPAAKLLSQIGSLPGLPAPPAKLPTWAILSFPSSFPPKHPSRRIYGVRELVAAVRTHLEKGFPDVWVEGEISNYRPAESGHLYLTLKDGDSQLRVVMFRAQARLLRFRPQNGMQVITRGRITMYEARGEMQLLAEYMEPMGAGALQVAFEQLKAKLAAEGLFAQERKKPLPALPRRIGVITSPRGAVIQDILNVLRRRHQSLNVLIYPAQVQGESAAGEVSAGIRFFNQQSESSANRRRCHPHRPWRRQRRRPGRLQR